MHTLIRPRTDDDLPALAKVLVEVHAVDGYPVEGVADPIAWLTLDNLVGAWTAELDGKPIAHVALTEPGTLDDAARLYGEVHGTAKPAVVLGRLFVSPTARGRGLAENLTRTAMSAAEGLGRVPVLDVMEKDRGAISLYRKLGWTVLDHVHHGHLPWLPFHSAQTQTRHKRALLSLHRDGNVVAWQEARGTAGSGSSRICQAITGYGSRSAAAASGPFQTRRSPWGCSSIWSRRFA